MILQAPGLAVSDTLFDSSQAQRLQKQPVYAAFVCRLSLYRSFLSCATGGPSMSLGQDVRMSILTAHGDTSGATPVRMALACVLLSSSLGKAVISLLAARPACRCCMRRLDLSHDRDRRDPYGTSTRLASSTGSMRAITGAPAHPACPLPARSADTAASRGASSRSATAPLEAVHAHVRHTGVPGHGLAVRCHHRVSCRLPHRADTAQAPAAIARAVIV